MKHNAEIELTQKPRTIWIYTKTGTAFVVSSNFLCTPGMGVILWG